jgi:hypothetical protein
MDIMERYFVKARDLVTRSILEEMIVVPIRNNVGDLNSIYTLNDVGTTIWESLDGKSSVGQIVAAIFRDYEVSLEEAAKNTVDFLEEMEKEGLIIPTGAGKG